MTPLPFGKDQPCLNENNQLERHLQHTINNYLCPCRAAPPCSAYGLTQSSADSEVGEGEVSEIHRLKNNRQQ